MKKSLNLLLAFLETLGSTAVIVSIDGFKTFIEYFLLTLKLVWEKSIKIREKVANIAKYLFVFIASPFVKMSINVSDMNKDLKEKKQSTGTFGAFLAFFPYLLRLIFGKRGIAVTAFNYAAPILSLVFLFNVVSYATSVNFTLKLTVNGEFLGYIENEQVFLDAEASVLKRVNYFGSDLTIEMIPEFSITSSGHSTMTMDEVSNQILRSADFTLVHSYGFFIDGNLHGAILEEDFHLIDRAMDSLLDKYRTGETDEEVVFLNHVVWDEYDVFLEESIVHPQKIITMITATNCSGEVCEGKNCEHCEPYLPVMVTRTEEYVVDVAFNTEHRNDDSLFEKTTKVTQKGEDGTNRCVARVAYINGEEIRRNVIESTVISEPITKIINIGTKQHTSGAIASQGADYGKFIWPVINASGRAVGGITQGYHGGHRAYDIAGNGLFGTPIVAVDSGVVVFVRYDNGNYGHTVIIQHANGLRTLYAHNSELQVVEGQEVSQGQQIANLGTTGKSTGPHLHFEVIDGNSKLDPGNYLQR
ncbi:MAG: peptidoglycan DD-metalloendopeptidase family protein, partial [Oscillospiraceae bacterium]|nr:peptidoglycan DD-metalloendopeptidase family protein [Oscillospiraceae bacterium]